MYATRYETHWVLPIVFRLHLLLLYRKGDKGKSKIGKLGYDLLAI